MRENGSSIDFNFISLASPAVDGNGLGDAWSAALFSFEIWSVYDVSVNFKLFVNGGFTESVNVSTVFPLWHLLLCWMRHCGHEVLL